MEAALGPDHPLLATPLINLSAAYHAMNQDDRAERRLVRAVAILERDPESPALATALEMFAVFLERAGRSEESDRLNARAQAIRDAQAR